jgi:GNAT superfamily N-acetyltransferase
MPLAIEIRRATPSDVPGIVQVKKQVWPDESTHAAQIGWVITEPTHATFVAASAGAIVGFVDGFSTLSGQGLSRWEVDLLAVHPGYQGQKLGARLVRACTHAGRQRGAALARGLVHVANVASQRTFARCAYQLDPTTCNLYVLPFGEKGVPLFQDVHWVPVNTFNYRGFWLEMDASAFSATPTRPVSADWDLVGAVIPTDQVKNNRTVQAASFTNIGEYQWWFLDLETLNIKDYPGEIDHDTPE